MIWINEVLLLVIYVIFFAALIKEELYDVDDDFYDELEEDSKNDNKEG